MTSIFTPDSLLSCRFRFSTSKSLPHVRFMRGTFLLCSYNLLSLSFHRSTAHLSRIVYRSKIVHLLRYDQTVIYPRQVSPSCQRLPPNALIMHLVYLLWVAVLTLRAVAVKPYHCEVDVRGQGQPELHSKTIGLCLGAGCRCLVTKQGRCAQYVEMGNLQQIWSHRDSPLQCRACKCRKIEGGSDDDGGDDRRVNRFKTFGGVKKKGGAPGGMVPVELFG